MSDVTDRLEVSVEDQTFRFTPRDVVSRREALSLKGFTGGRRSRLGTLRS